ncbi:MAG: hypothetical protein WCL32_25665, partial [Planctomycetota bacterium]
IQTPWSLMVTNEKRRIGNSESELTECGADRATARMVGDSERSVVTCGKERMMGVCDGQSGRSSLSALVEAYVGALDVRRTEAGCENPHCFGRGDVEVTDARRIHQRSKGKIHRPRVMPTLENPTREKISGRGWRPA